MGARQSSAQTSSTDNVVLGESSDIFDDYDLPVSQCRRMNMPTSATSSSSDSSSSLLSLQSSPSWWRSDRGFQIFGRNHDNNDDGTCQDVNVTVAAHEENESAFSVLGDDIVLEIMSYVATGPCEKGSMDSTTATTTGTLTHILPFVSRRFYGLCHSSSLLWLEALGRLVLYGDCDGSSRQDDDEHSGTADWVEAGLLVLLGNGHTRPTWSCYHNPAEDRNDFMLASEVKTFIRRRRKSSLSTPLWDDWENQKDETGKEVDKARQLLRQVCNSAILRVESNKYGRDIEQSMNSKAKHSSTKIEESSERKLYLTLVRDHAVLTLPILRSQSGSSNSFFPPNIGQTRKIRLYGGEGHHRSLIDKIIEGRLDSELNWGRKWMKQPRPKFLMVQDNGEGGSAASHSYIMEVLRFRGLPDNGAYVLVRATTRTVPLKITRRMAETVDGNYDENDTVLYEHYDAHVKRFHIS